MIENIPRRQKVVLYITLLLTGIVLIAVLSLSLLRPSRPSEGTAILGGSAPTRELVIAEVETSGGTLGAAQGAATIEPNIGTPIPLPGGLSPTEIPSYPTVLAAIETADAAAAGLPARAEQPYEAGTSDPISYPPPPSATVAPAPELLYSLPTAPTLETRIETEGASRMAVGRSSLVSVRVVNVAVGAPTSTPEQQGAAVREATAIIIGTPGPAALTFGSDYVALVTASLTGSAFDITPAQQETEYRLLEQGMVSWDWSVTPKQPGERELIVVVDIEYRHKDGSPIVVHRLGRQRLDVEVTERLVEQGPPIQWATVLLSALAFVLGIIATKVLERLMAGKRKAGGSRRKR